MSQDQAGTPVPAPAPSRPGGPGGPGAPVARNALFLVMGQVATTALAIVLSAALGRSLGAEEFGTYYLVTTMCAFAYVFVEWGQPLFVVRQVATAPARSGLLLGNALAIRCALAAAVIGPVGLVAWLIGYRASTAGLAMALVVASLPLFLAQAYSMVFRGSDRMGSEAALSVANKVFLLALTLPALALGLRLPGVVVAQGLAGLAAIAVAVRLHRRLALPRPRLSAEVARELLVAGAPFLALAAASSVQPYLDVMLLDRLAPAQVVGWFGAARNILGTLMAPAVILGAALYPRLARAASDPATLREAVRAALRPMLWLGALAGIGTYLFAGTAVGLIFGARAFGGAVAIMQAFAPGLFLLFIDVLLGYAIFASGAGSGFTVAKIVSVPIGTALDFLLIPWFQARHGNGGMGVMVAFSLSELVVFAGALWVLRPGTFGLPALLDVGRALGAAGATALLFALLPGVPAWVGIPLCLAAFTAASLALGLTSRRELGSLLQALRRKEAAAR